MKRKIVAVWVSLAMLFGFVVIVDVVTDIAPHVRAATITVDDSGGADYLTIQEGIDAANPGDTVFVYSGTYYENVVVDKSINLMGEDKNNPIVDGGKIGIVIYVTTNWVNVTGFTICNSGDFYSGIILEYVQHCRVSENIVKWNKDGLHILWSSNISIINNNISFNNGDGILFESFSEPSSGNIFKYNFVSFNNLSGIFIQWSSNNTIMGNSVISNKFYGILLGYTLYNDVMDNILLKDGIFLIGDQLSHYNSHKISPNNTVNNKSFLFQKDSTGIVIDGDTFGQVIFANCSDSTIKNLQINQTDVGIEIAYSTNITILDNVVTDSFGGIYLPYSSNSSISGNNFSSNIREGVYLMRSPDNNLTHNDIFLNNGTGLELYYSSNINITNNNISSNYWGILQSWGSTKNTISSNDVSYRSHYGIHLGGSFSTVTGNNVFSNSDGGFDLSGHDNIISENNVFNNTNYGIYVGGAQDEFIVNNNITGNWDGIYLESARWINITNNNVSNNSHYGIVLEESDDNEILDNIISMNHGYGIDINTMSDYNLFMNNNISNTSRLRQ